MIYNAVNLCVASLVDPKAARILDFGCGSGEFGKYLRSLRSCYIAGVTYSQDEALTARSCLDEVIVADLNTFSPEMARSFDVIVCSHVLEHLYDPHAFLQRLRANLKPSAQLVIGLPNILFWKQRLKFLLGYFRYTGGGLMDSTHFRFFDHVTARNLPEEAGFHVSQFIADGSLPLPGLRKILPASLARKIDLCATRLFPGLFGFQFVMLCLDKSNLSPNVSNV